MSYATLGSISFSMNVWGIGDTKLRRGSELNEVCGSSEVCNLLEEEDDVLSIGEVKRRVHLLCGFFASLGPMAVGDGMLVPTVCELNGVIEWVLTTGSACVGKEKVNGNVCRPEANRRSDFCFSGLLEFVSSDWSGSPVDLSQTLNSRFRNGREPPV